MFGRRKKRYDEAIKACSISTSALRRLNGKATKSSGGQAGEGPPSPPQAMGKAAVSSLAKPLALTVESVPLKGLYEIQARTSAVEC